MSGTGVHVIIHGAATAAAGVGAGLAQAPGSDTPIILTIQTGMVVGIAEQYGVSLKKVAAADLVLTFAAAMAGRGASQALVGWFPLWGNLLNATTAAAITEAIGWAANAYFADPGEKRAKNTA